MHRAPYSRHLPISDSTSAWIEAPVLDSSVHNHEQVDSVDEILPTVSPLECRRRDMQLKSLRQAAGFTMSDEFQTASPQAISIRSKALHDHWHEFKISHWDLVSKADECDLSDHELVRTQAEEVFLRATEAFKSVQDRRGRHGIESHAGPGIVHVELGDTSYTDRIAKFDGNFAKWATFRDSFKAAVLDRTDLRPVQKLLRLQQSVTGMAADILGQWTLTPENLQLAWDQLCRAYNNEYQTIRAHIRELFEMPTIKAESYSGIRGLINTVTNTSRQLASLLDPDARCEFMIMYLLENRMPASTRTAWEMHRDTNTRPKLSNMLACLERRATGLAGISSPVHCDSDSGSKFRNERRSSSQAPRQTERGSRASTRQSLPPCPMCSADHGLFRCDKFLAMKLVSRLEYVRQARLCTSCLRVGHAVEACPKPQYGCRNCTGEHHNTAICPKRKTLIDGQQKSESVASTSIPLLSQAHVVASGGTSQD